MKISLLVFGISVALFMACQNKSSQKDEVTTNNKEMEAVHSEDHSSDMSVHLNNGQKWTANAETTDGIKNMSAMVNEIGDANDKADCMSLKGQLITEFDALIQKCTMTGEAHEQLHKYLIPLRKKFEALDATDGTGCGKAIDDIRQHLDAFNNYFV
jgi:hypothetical protein